MKIICGLVGLLIGVLASYLFRPVTLFGVPSIADWFSPRAIQEFSGSTIAICTVIGGIVGLVAGAVLEKNQTSKSLE